MTENERQDKIRDLEEIIALRRALREELEAHDYFMEQGRTKPGYTMEIWRTRRELAGLPSMGRRFDVPVVLPPEGDTPDALERAVRLYAQRKTRSRWAAVQEALDPVPPSQPIPACDDCGADGAGSQPVIDGNVCIGCLRARS